MRLSMCCHGRGLQVTESIFTVYQHGCSYFQLCNHARLSSQLTALFHDGVHPGNPHVEWAIGLPAAAEAIACYAKRNIELHAPRWANQVCTAMGFVLLGSQVLVCSSLPW